MIEEMLNELGSWFLWIVLILCVVYFILKFNKKADEILTELDKGMRMKLKIETKKPDEIKKALGELQAGISEKADELTKKGGAITTGYTQTGANTFELIIMYVTPMPFLSKVIDVIVREELRKTLKSIDADCKVF